MVHFFIMPVIFDTMFIPFCFKSSKQENLIQLALNIFTKVLEPAFRQFYIRRNADFVNFKILQQKNVTIFRNCINLNFLKNIYLQG